MDHHVDRIARLGTSVLISGIWYKVAGRVTEMVTRIKVALPSAFPYQVGFADLAGRIAKLPP
jgi:hypothetical protein